jgi:hypothetical protein
VPHRRSQRLPGYVLPGVVPAEYVLFWETHQTRSASLIPEFMLPGKQSYS